MGLCLPPSFPFASHPYFTINFLSGPPLLGGNEILTLLLKSLSAMFAFWIYSPPPRLSIYILHFLAYALLAIWISNWHKIDSNPSLLRVGEKQENSMHSYSGVSLNNQQTSVSGIQKWDCCTIRATLLKQNLLDSQYYFQFTFVPLQLKLTKQHAIKEERVVNLEGRHFISSVNSVTRLWILKEPILETWWWTVATLCLRIYLFVISLICR